MLADIQNKYELTAEFSADDGVTVAVKAAGKLI